MRLALCRRKPGSKSAMVLDGRLRQSGQGAAALPSPWRLGAGVLALIPSSRRLRRAVHRRLERSKHRMDMQRDRAGITKAVPASGRHDQRLAGSDDRALLVDPHRAPSTPPRPDAYGSARRGRTHCSKMHSCAAPLTLEATRRVSTPGRHVSTTVFVRSMTFMLSALRPCACDAVRKRISGIHARGQRRRI